LVVEQSRKSTTTQRIWENMGIWRCVGAKLRRGFLSQ
jgi:hypothetical protein